MPTTISAPRLAALCQHLHPPSAGLVADAPAAAGHFMAGRGLERRTIPRCGGASVTFVGFGAVREAVSTFK